MEGRGRGRGRGDGGGRGRGGDRGGGGGRGGGGERGGFSGRGRGQQRDDQSRGPQFPGGRGGGGGGSSGGDRGGDQGFRQRNEGDWACSSCGFNNFARNQECYKCKTGRSGGGGERGYDRGGDQGSRQRGGDGDWACSSCGFNNFARNQDCYKCKTGRSGGSSSGGGGRQGGGQRGGHSEGGFHRGGRGGSDGGYQRGGGGGRGGRGGGRGGGFGGGGGGREIDWDEQERMETASQSSSCSDPAAAELAAKMEKMRLNDLPEELRGEDKNKYSVIPHRINKGPVVGTRGRKITIEVNHVQLKFDSKKTVAIHYDCAFKPDKLSRKVLRRIMNILRERRYPNRYPAFDGKKNLYACGSPLFRGKELTETVELPAEEGDSRPLKVEVTIKEVDGESRIDLSLIAKYMQRQIRDYPQKPVQVMEIVLRNAPASAGFTQVGRSFFTAPNPSITLGNGLELYHGFFQSVVLGWQTFLNVDVAHKGFPEARPVIDLMCEFKNTRGQPKPYPQDMRFFRDELDNFLKFIKGLRVMYAIPGIPTSRRKFTVIGVRRPANEQTFIFKRNDNDRGQEMTIEQYFREQKNYRLNFPHLPCLHVGDPKRNVCLPPELCRVVVGQVMMKKLDPDQTRQMIRQAATRPDERKEKIMNAMRSANFNQDDCVREFGVNVGQQFATVSARVLTPPTIDYGDQKKADPANGEWRVQTFKQATSLDKWAIATVGMCGINDMRQVVDRFKSVCREVGMNVAEPCHTDCLVQGRMSDQDIERTLLQAFREYKNKGMQIVVMIIPDKKYDTVKKVAEIDVGLLTQCILEKTMRRMDASTGKNLLLKINAKLNGVNHTVVRNVRERLKSDRVMELLKNTMLMGADVTHPSPDQKEIPSVAAVTASHDPLQFQYNMVYRLQNPKQEIIGDLYRIVIQQLRFYKAKNGRWPDRIIFYRDGVSEGQFIQVLQVEMTCIKRACIDELGHDLPVTFLVVQKRHHTRFFPVDKRDMDRKGNVPPGTVVDTTITHPEEADFYMVSHASLQGTSRPTKYHKLWDDNQINEDDLEEMTFFLCHMFSRCTRSVSYPAPTYYAHLGAARGKTYLQGAKVNIKELAREMERRTIHANIVNGSPMFFT